MRDRVGLLIALALASGLIAAILAFNFLRSPSAPDQFQRASAQSVPVVVAARDLAVGSSLVMEDVRVVDWPGDAIPAGYASSVTEVMGRGVMVPIRMNEPLLPEKLAGEDLGRGLTMLIPDGYRAMSVPVNDVVAVAGWVRPGTRVDVLVTLNSVRNQQEPVTQIVLQNVQVLGNDRSIQQNAEGEPQAIAVVTVLVTPEQAERLAMAESEGRLQLVLRGQIDLDTLETPGVRTSELLRMRGGPVVQGPRGPVRPAQPSRVTVEVYRGPTRSESTVERGGGGG
jgi:pilus assembly protein CpaB